MFSISLLCGGIENLCHAVDFRSDQLEEISRHLKISLPGCDTTMILRSGDRDLTIRIADDCVEHIGYRIFPDEFRSSVIPPHIADFIERYWLSLTLPLERNKPVSQQLKEDKFIFRKGDINTVGLLQRDSMLSISCTMDHSGVVVTWEKEDRPVCEIIFPKDHEMILGRKMMENDRRLPAEIRSAEIGPRDGSDTMALSLSQDTVTSLWISNTGSYLDCNLKSDRYYDHVEEADTYIPVFEPERMSESIANLFTGYDIEKADGIKLEIRLIKFGFEEEIIETTIPKFVAYCKCNGCEPFVGIVSVDENEPVTADVLVMMRNWEVGYNHLLRVSLPLACIASGKGTSTARMNAFIPASNVKNLFKEYY